MPLSYDRLFKLLEEKGYNSYRIRKENLIGQATLTHLRRGTGGIDYRTIEKICEAFDCQPNDIMEYIKNAPTDNP